MEKLRPSPCRVFPQLPATAGRASKTGRPDQVQQCLKVATKSADLLNPPTTHHFIRSFDFPPVLRPVTMSQLFFKRLALFVSKNSEAMAFHRADGLFDGIAVVRGISVAEMEQSLAEV